MQLVWHLLEVGKCGKYVLCVLERGGGSTCVKPMPCGTVVTLKDALLAWSVVCGECSGGTVLPLPPSQP